MYQLRTLADRMRMADVPKTDGNLTQAHLLSLGFRQEYADRIVGLLEDDVLLHEYLCRAERTGCIPITRASEIYPLILRKRLGLDCPGVLWAKGDLSLLNTPCVSLVGSRDLNPQNRDFAQELGRQAAKQSVTLVSGNARGADFTAQESCLREGGRIISVVADALADHRERDNVLYLSEEDFDAPFSAQRALSRNRIIHSIGLMTFVAQCALGKGGTWDGTTRNLRLGYSPVLCFRDESPASAELEQLGAFLINAADLGDFFDLQQMQRSLFEMS